MVTEWFREMVNNGRRDWMFDLGFDPELLVREWAGCGVGPKGWAGFVFVFGLDLISRVRIGFNNNKSPRTIVVFSEFVKG